MNTAELIYEKSKQLPESVTVQILDFVEYLEQKYRNSENTQTPKSDIMAHLQSSIEKNRRLGELLAK